MDTRRLIQRVNCVYPSLPRRSFNHHSVLFRATYLIVHRIENLIARRVSKISFSDHLCLFDPSGALCREFHGSQSGARNPNPI